MSQLRARESIAGDRRAHEQADTFRCRLTCVSVGECCVVGKERFNMACIGLLPVHAVRTGQMQSEVREKVQCADRPYRRVYRDGFR